MRTGGTGANGVSVRTGYRSTVPGTRTALPFREGGDARASGEERRVTRPGGVAESAYGHATLVWGVCGQGGAQVSRVME